MNLKECGGFNPSKHNKKKKEQKGGIGIERGKFKNEKERIPKASKEEIEAIKDWT
ncbi:MAG: hypothetical protein ABIJ83_01900 [Patescibacteria group bacterium]